MTSDNDGLAACTLDLPLGQYYVKELKAPAGFVSSDEVLNLDASYQGQDVKTVKLKTVKKNQPTTVEITKSDVTTGVELDGAKLTVLDKEGNVVDQWTSVKDQPHVIKRLTVGKEYTLREEIAPYGYLKATDVKFTLVAGRAHLKHTEGGDFRQATYRAVRQGLMQAENVLLEPYYDFRLEVPAECVGRAMTDLQNMGGTVEPPQNEGENAVLTGYAPVRTLRDYFAGVAAYTRGRGQLSCAVRGYEACQNQDEIVASLGYDAERDTDNPASSVFCDHGGSITVPWNEVPAHVHCDSGIRLGEEAVEEAPAPLPRRGVGAGGAYAEDEELQDIFERTYGKVERRAFEPSKKPARTSLADHYDVTIHSEDTEYLLVDGYNIIFAWNELHRLAAQDVAAARGALIDILANYQGFRKCRVIVVFDAYKVKGNPGSVQTVHGVKVVYTKEAETADTYIERATYELRRERRVRVATSDGPKQIIILGHGALRVSARAFHAEVEAAEGQISAVLQRLTNRPRSERTIRNNVKLKQ